MLTGQDASLPLNLEVVSIPSRSRLKQLSSTVGSWYCLAQKNLGSSPNLSSIPHQWSDLWQTP